MKSAVIILFLKIPPKLREEHKKLAQCFKTTKNKCLMIIGKTPFIEEHNNGYIVGEYDKKYRFKLHSGRIDEEDVDR